MTDKEKAEKAVLSFLDNPNKRVLLIRGYDNEAKINVAIRCLNRRFKKGIIRTSSMSDIPDRINEGFKKKVISHNVTSTKKYKLGKMSVVFSSYVRTTNNNFRGNQDTFTLYHPVQSVLDDKKRYAEFLEDLKKNNSSKIILITTIEWSIKNMDIENHVDEVYFYSVEEDNPNIMINLRKNGAI